MEGDPEHPLGQRLAVRGVLVASAATQVQLDVGNHQQLARSAKQATQAGVRAAKVTARGLLTAGRVAGHFFIPPLHPGAVLFDIALAFFLDWVMKKIEQAEAKKIGLAIATLELPYAAQLRRLAGAAERMAIESWDSGGFGFAYVQPRVELQHVTQVTSPDPSRWTARLLDVELTVKREVDRREKHSKPTPTIEESMNMHYREIFTMTLPTRCTKPALPRLDVPPRRSTPSWPAIAITAGRTG